MHEPDLGLVDCPVSFAKAVCEIRREPCRSDCLHGKGCVPKSAVAVALHLHPVLSQPKVVWNARQVPARQLTPALGRNLKQKGNDPVLLQSVRPQHLDLYL